MKLAVLTIVLSLIVGCNTTGTKVLPVLNAETSAMKLTEASMAMQSQDYPRALDLVKSSIRHNPDNAKAHSVAGLIYQRQGLSQQAQGYFSKAIQLAPNDPAIRNNFGNYLCAERKYGAAEENFLIAANSPGNAQPDTALTNAGLCALRANESNRAKDFFSKAVQANSAQTIALYQLALMSQRNADAVTASGFLQHYLTHKSHSAKTLMLAANIESDLSNNESYRNLLQQLVRDFPDSPEATQAQFLLTSQNISQEGTYQDETINTVDLQPVIASPTTTTTYEDSSYNTSNPVIAYENDTDVIDPTSTGDNDWILARDPSRYTIQIYTAGENSNLQEVAGLLPATIVGTPSSFGFRHKGEQKYTLIAGDFENASDARSALVALPDSVKQYQPWIRRFDSIQRVINSKGLN